MVTNNLVSIITPCYNGEKFVGRFLESILNQTYNNIELIIINDGSTDKTEEIILSYQEKFKARGYNFIYLYQQNAGQSAAINKGLKKFSGKYLTWPDSDDMLTIDAIEKKVDFLEKNTNIGTVICKTQVVDNDSLRKIGIQQRIKPRFEDNIFLDLIIGNNVYYSPGGYMVRSSMFRASMPDSMQIESPREIGQNYQLLLPIIFYYPVGYIEDICYIYTVRKGSHSRINHTFEEDKRIVDIAQRVLKNIVSNLKIDDNKSAKIDKTLEIHKLRSYVRIMLKHRRKDFLEKVESAVTKNGIKDKEIRKGLLRIKYPMINLICRIQSKIKSIIIKTQ